MVPGPADDNLIVTTTIQEERGSMMSEPAPQEEQRVIRSKNYHLLANTLGFVLNLVITYGVGTLGWFGTATNAQLSEKYQSLVTPKSTAFSIWAVIFLSQAIFVGVQWLPAVRNKALIYQGVGYYYVGTCIFQAAWTIAFGREVIWLSLIWMVAIWLTLLAIVHSQYRLMKHASIIDFWLLAFPFAIHCGWITAASALNINVLVIDKGGTAAVQLAVAIVSLAGLHAASVWVLFGLTRPIYTVATVVAWASWWIFQELKSPKELIVNTFALEVIQGVSYAAATVAVIVLTQIAIRVFVAAMQLLKHNDEDATIAHTIDSSMNGNQQESHENDCHAA